MKNERLVLAISYGLLDNTTACDSTYFIYTTCRMSRCSRSFLLLCSTENPFEAHIIVRHHNALTNHPYAFPIFLIPEFGLLWAFNSQSQ